MIERSNVGLIGCRRKSGGAIERDEDGCAMLWAPSVADASGVLQGFELTDSVEAVALALEERLSSQLLKVARLSPYYSCIESSPTLAALRGAVPAKESTCYEIASLISKQGAMM